MPSNELPIVALEVAAHDIRMLLISLKSIRVAVHVLRT